jgi:undecaprenyl-diphosphatase
VAHSKTAAATLATVVTDPLRVLKLLTGAAGITMAYTLTLTAAIQAFGGGLSLPQIGAAYLVAAALASAAPTPGGLGALEAALVAALTGYGMADSRAISAVLLFRLATFWLPVLPGYLTFQQMQRRGEL